MKNSAVLELMAGLELVLGGLSFIIGSYEVGFLAIALAAIFLFASKDNSLPKI
jgi:hypothetical protein